MLADSIAIAKQMRTLDLQVEEENNDYAPAFRKKMSLPNQHSSARGPAGHVRAHTTLKYTQTQPLSRPVVTADPMSRAAIRFKKVGNLMTVEKQNANGGRVNTLSKTMGPALGNNATLFINSAEPSPHNSRNKFELDELKR